MEDIWRKGSNGFYPYGVCQMTLNVGTGIIPVTCGDYIVLKDNEIRVYPDKLFKFLFEEVK